MGARRPLRTLPAGPGCTFAPPTKVTSSSIRCSPIARTPTAAGTGSAPPTSNAMPASPPCLRGWYRRWRADIRATRSASMSRDCPPAEPWRSHWVSSIRTCFVAWACIRDFHTPARTTFRRRSQRCATAARGCRPQSAAGRSAPGVPTIVFHGDRDSTVNLRNAADVVEDARGRAGADGPGGEIGRWSETVATGAVAGGYRFTTTTARDATGRVRLESWVVHGGGHAWFGGDPGGSFVDPKGPDASAEMLRFFRELT